MTKTITLEPSKKEYVIYGALDNGTPNVDIFFSSKDKDEAVKLYKELMQLQLLCNEQQYDAFKKRYEALQEAFEIELFSEDDWIDDEPVDWEVNGLYEQEEIKVAPNDHDEVRE